VGQESPSLTIFTLGLDLGSNYNPSVAKFTAFGPLVVHCRSQNLQLFPSSDPQQPLDEGSQWACPEALAPGEIHGSCPEIPWKWASISIERERDIYIYINIFAVQTENENTEYPLVIKHGNGIFPIHAGFDGIIIIC